MPTRLFLRIYKKGKEKRVFSTKLALNVIKYDNIKPISITFVVSYWPRLMEFFWCIEPPLPGWKCDIGRLPWLTST